MEQGPAARSSAHRGAWPSARPWWETFQQCLPAAVSVELIHRTSIIFDNIQDHSPERNHRPALSAVWGVEQAIDAAQALSSYSQRAFLRMLEQGSCADTIPEAQRILEERFRDVCQGQFLDLAFRRRLPTLEEYLTMVWLKIGLLLGVAREVGAVVAQAAPEPSFHPNRSNGQRAGLPASGLLPAGMGRGPDLGQGTE